MQDKIYSHSIGSGPPLVLIHGYGANNCSWNLVKSELAKHYTVYLIDLIGFGRSQPSDDFSYTINDQAAALNVFISSLDQAPKGVIAHSYGAAVLLTGIIEYDWMFEKIVLVGALAFREKPPFFISAQTIPVFSYLSSYIIPASAQVDMVLNKVYYNKSKINDEIERCYIENFDMPYFRNAARKTANHLSNFDPEPYIQKYRFIPHYPDDHVI